MTGHTSVFWGKLPFQNLSFPVHKMKKIVPVKQDLWPFNKIICVAHLEQDLHIVLNNE
jgi:hypothetical protein